LVIESDASEAENTADWVERCLADGMRRYVTQVPIRIETQIAVSWGGEA
jgi:hypothetical protein